MKHCAKLAVCLTLFIVLTIGFWGLGNAEEVASGTCGDNLTWMLEDGVLTISGTGEMEDYTSGGAPWYEDRASIASLNIEDGVTSIGQYAFYTCTKITEIDIPEGVTTIGAYAFGSCTRLKKVSFPDSYTFIESDAFNNCGNVTEAVIGSYFLENNSWDSCTLTDVFSPNGPSGVVIKDTITYVGEYSFYECSNLTYFYVDSLEQWLSYDHSTGFYLKNTNGKLYISGELATNLTIPDSVTSIGNYAFRNCATLTSITIPDSVTSIGNYAFCNCTGLTSITIPDSVTSIGEYAFSGCTGLTSITIPDSVTSIGYSVFSGCSSLTSITIPDSIISVGNSAFRDCSNLSSITIPDSVTSIGDYAFCWCNNLSDIHVDSIEQWLSYQHSKTSLYLQTTDGKLYIGGELVTEIRIPDSITTVNEYTFHSCNSLTSITIPDSVTSIGYGAFGGCSNLSEIHVDSIEQWLGYDHTTTEGLYLYGSNGKLYIGGELLTDLVISDGVQIIGENAFRKCSSLKSVAIGGSVSSIGNYSFAGCKNLSTVTIQNGVTSIGNYAFSGCSGLTNITISSGVTSIGDCAFYNCSSLTSITIPDGATSIGDSTFWGCSNLSSITIPDSVTSIGNYAFFGCNSLSEIHVDSIEQWLSYDHSYATDLYLQAEEVKLYIDNELVTSIEIPDTVTSIGERVFWHCSSLTCITIPDSVTSIGDRAFYGCRNLSSLIVLSKNTISIPDSSSVFSGCTNLTIYGYKDSYIQKYAKSNKIPFVVLQSISAITFDTIYIEPGEIVDLMNYVHYTPEDAMISGFISDDPTSSVFSLSGGMKILGLSEGTDCIVLTETASGLQAVVTVVVYPHQYSFNSVILAKADMNGEIIYKCDYCPSTTSIPIKSTAILTLPTSLSSISSESFSGISAQQIIVPDGCTSIASQAFANCSQLKAIVIPNSVKSIADDVFDGCENFVIVCEPDSSAQQYAIVNNILYYCPN